jgi:hypothetical protein
MKIKFMLVIALAFLLSGCSTKLSPKASKLTFISDTNKDRYECSVLDSIVSQATGGFNIPQRSMSYIKNKAAQKNANAYRVIFSHYNWSTSILVGEALSCKRK